MNEREVLLALEEIANCIGEPETYTEEYVLRIALRALGQFS